MTALSVEIAPNADSPVTWQLAITNSDGGNLQGDELEDMFLVLGYEWAGD